MMAGRREIEDLKPIVETVLGTGASHRAVTKVNAQVAPKVRSPGGRVCNRRMKAAWAAAVWLKRCATPAG